MATTYNDNGGSVNGVNKEFTFSFPYLKTEDVKVSLNGLTQAATKYTVSTSPTKITFNDTSVDATVQVDTGTNKGAPLSGVTVRVYRDTDVDTAKAVYSAGSSVRAADLNDNQDQILYALQEEQSDTINTHRLTDGSVTRDKLRADAIDGTKIADDSINSEHYAAGSIDLEHMSANSVDSDQYVDGSIDTVHIANDQVTYAKIQNVSNTDRVLGRDSAGAGDVEEISPAALRAMLNIEDGSTGDLTNAEIRAAVEAASDSNVFTDADHSKLDGIDTGAKDDQTAAEIRALVESASDSNVFTDADHNKLNSIATSAEVNVQSDWNASSGDAQILNKPTIPSNLADLANVHNATPTDGQVLKWINSNSRWEPAADATGAGGAALTDGDKGDITVSGTGAVWTIDNNTIGIDELSATGSSITTKFLRGDNTWAAAGAEVTVQDEGSSLSTAATTLNFVGSGVTASGTGATKTITISGGGGATSTDFKYLELRNAANNGAASYPASDFTLVTAGTTTALTPSAANGLIVSVSGVIQQPNTGTSTPTSGFAVTGSTIKFGSAIAAAPDFIIYLQGAGVASVNPNSVTEAMLQVSNAPTNDYLLSAQSSAGGGLTWVAAPSGTPEGTAVKSTTNSNEAATKFLRADGDGTCSWQVPSSTDATKMPLAGGTFTGDVTINNTSSNPQLALVSANNGISEIQFGDGADAVRGNILYRSGTAGDALCFNGYNNTERLRIDSTGRIGIGTSLISSYNGGADDLIIDNGANDVGITLDSETQATLVFTDSAKTGFDGWVKYVHSDNHLEIGVNGSERARIDSSGNLKIPNDTGKLTLGTDADLAIYHDGHSRIKSTSGSLKFLSDSVEISNADNDENMAIFTADGSVELYFNHNKKFETSNTGVTVTGTVAATAYTGDGSALTGISAGASADGCIYKNTLTISNNHTIAATEGAHSVGPITNNATVTINGRWVIS